MHPRHRSPGNGYRSSPMGMGGVAAASQISPESSFRGHGMYNSDYRSYNRSFGRGQPKPFQAAHPQPPPPPQRRTNIFMEAGHLATEYLVSKGLLPPNVLSARLQNGSLRNQVGEFQGFRSQEGDGSHITLDGRAWALARLGNASDAGSGRKRFGDEYNYPTGSRSYMRGTRRMRSFKNYGSDWGQGMERSGSFTEKSRISSDVEGDDSFSRYPEEKRIGNGVGNDSQMSKSARKIDGVVDSKSGLEKSQFDDDTTTAEVSADVGKVAPTESDAKLAKMPDDVSLLNKDTFELKNDTIGDQVEEQSETKDATIEHFAVEGDSISKNGGGGLLSLCRFAKIPTRTRSSFTARGLKVDPVPPTEEVKNYDKGQEEDHCDVGLPLGSDVPVKDVSVDASTDYASSNQIQQSKCLDSDIIDTSVTISVEDAGEFALVCTKQGKYLRSQSYPGSSFMNNQESGDVPPGFGRGSSMILERGEKRTAEHTDSGEETKKRREWVPSVATPSDECLHLSHIRRKQLTSQEERKSPGHSVVLAKDQGRTVDMSSFPIDDAGKCIEYLEEKQLFPISFKICDLNLMEASEVNENTDRNPMIIFPSIPESKTAATPVDVGLSTSNNCSISGKFGTHGVDGKEVEVIDLEDDSIQEDNTFDNLERKEEPIFTHLESFPNHAQSTNDISDTHDGYGLMISELLGTDITNCSSVPADINSLHNDMALHNGEGILGDDESIYMSLGEIPISFLRVWEHPGQEYDKPF